MKKIVILALIFIDLNGSVNNLNNITKNSLHNSNIIDSVAKQGNIDIDSSSLVEDVNIGKSGDLNILKESSISNSTLNQGSVDINSSSLIRSSIYSNGEILSSDIKNGSNIKQSVVSVKNSGIVEDSSFTLNSSIDNASISNSDISQNEIDIDNATVDNLNLTGNHTIYNETETVNILNSNIVQGRLSVVNGSSLTDSTINMSSNIDHSNISNSSIDLCSIYVKNGANVSNANINGTCTMDSVDITGANLIQGAVVVYN